MDKTSLNAVANEGEKSSPHRIRLHGPSKAQFEKIFSTGQSINSLYFRLIFRPGTGKIGIATSKSIGCHAKRNRIKRRVKVIVQSHLHLLDLGQDWVVTVKGSGGQVGFEQLEKELCKNLTNAQQRLAGGQQA